MANTLTMIELMTRSIGVFLSPDFSMRIVQTRDLGNYVCFVNLISL